MRRPPRTLSFLLFLFWLGTSWEAHLPHPFIRSNATVFSHVYTIKLAGEGPEAEGASPAPQEALGPPGSSRGGGLYEHTLEGPDQEHVVFTHRINLPTQACGCPPGTEDTQDLLRRLQALENEVRALRDTCQAGGGCCPATASSQASTGQTDIRTLCSHHGSFDVSRCVCECEPGWSGPTCAEPACPGGCGGPQRGKCVNRRCQCRPGYSGTHCEEPPTCPDDCNDQGRCVDGRCTCFPGYVGPSCADPACPEGCQGHGQCVSGRCVCNPGYSGPDCGSRACPSNCNRRGECRNGRCVCETGFTGPACGTKTCPNDCSQRGRCLKGAVCACFKGYTGPDCSQLACPEDCNGHGECQNGVCLCHDGFSGDDCSIEIPTIGVRVSNRDETSFRLEWNRPGIPVDGYEINVIPTHDQVVGESVRLPSTETVFERRGLKPGEEYLVTIRAEKGQSYGPPVTQPVRTRVAPPLDLHSSQVTENTVTLDWEPPASRPDGYILSYVPLVATQPTQAPKRVELPAEPESVTLEDLESNTPYRITLIARQNGENSRGSSIIVSTTAPAPSQPIRRYSTPSPSSHLEPDNSFTRPGSRKPGIKPHPGSALSNTTKARELFMKKMTENISAKLSPFNGTLLERLESYLWATNFPLHGNRTIQTVARDIYLYLILRKPEEVIEKVKDLLDKEMDDSLPKREFPIGEADSAYSDGYSRPDHAKPAVVASSSDGIEVSLDGVRGVSDNVVIRYRNTGSGEGGEFMVPGDASTALITGLDPGTTYHVEIHGVVKGHSSKSYSFITSTAPGSPSAAEIQTVPSPTLTPEVPLRDLTVTDVSPNSLRMVWSAPPSSFSSFSLQYRDPKSSAPPREIRVPGTERSVAVMGLSPNTDYELELSGEKPNGIYSPPVTTKASTAPAPEAEKPTLGKISVSEVTDNSARLSWDVPTGSFDSFLIQYKDAEGKPKGLPVDGGSREVTVSNLAPSRKYKFNLYGLVGRKRVGPVSTETVTAPRTAPPSLGELSTSDITSDSVRLFWSIPSGSFDSFLVQYKDAEGRPQVLPMEGDSREVTIPSLVPSHRYRFNLYGISNRKRLGPATTDVTTASREEEPVPEPMPEPVLGDLSVSDATSNTVRLTWNVPTDRFDSFLLQYQDPEGNDQTLRINRDSREIAVPNLVPSQRYRFNLYGISGTQLLGPVSADVVTAESQETITERPDETILTPPSLGELWASDVTSDSICLSWTVPTGSFDSFLVQYKDSEGKPQALPVDGSSREVTVPNLVPSRRYKFNLYGVLGRKRSSPISTDATTASSRVTEGDAVQPSLGELTVSDVTSDSVHLSWTVPTGTFDSFLIQYKDAEGRPQALPVEGGACEVIVPNLVPSRRYKFNLYGVSGRKRSGPISTDATTATSPVVTTERIITQLSLDQLSVSDITSDSARLSWTVPTGNFDSFLVQYKDAEGKPQWLPVDGASRTLTVPNLEPSQRYTFNLYGRYGGKRYGPLSVEAVTALSPHGKEVLPSQPTLGELSAHDVSSDSLRLSWTVPTGHFDSFLIQYKDAEGNPQALPVDGGSREVTVSSLVPSHRYKFNFYGVSGHKRIGPISTDAVTAPPIKKPTLPLRLGELTASNAMPNSLDLSWTVEDGDFDSFIIQYRDAQGKPQVLPIDGGLRSLHLHDLAPSHRYQINIYGVSGRKRLGPISTEAETAPLPTTPPPQPSLGEVSVSDVTSDSVRLSWTVPTGNFDSFLIQYKDAEGRAQAVPLEGASREVSIPNLAPSRRYKFNLYGVSGHKRLGPLSADTVTAPLPTTPPPQPSLGEVSVSDVTSDSVRLSWTVPTGSFDSFLIQYKDAEGKPQVVPVEGASREVSIPNLTPSRRYKFNLYGVSGRKRLGPLSADTVTASPPQEPPIPPSLGELSASDVTSNSIHLSWTVPMGTFDSFLVQYKDSEGKPQAIPVGGALRETIVPNLVPSRRYKFNLYGLTGRKRLGPISTDAVTAAAEIRAAPTLGELSVSNVTSESVRLSWTVPTGNFDSFLIQYKDAEGKAQALPLEGGTLETTITGLSPARRYKFNLYGLVGRKRLGPVSADTVTAVQEEDKMKPSVGELSVSDVTSNSALLSWTVPSGSFDSFLIQYKDSEGKPQALPVEGASREVTVPNLAPSHRYKFNLYGISGRKRLGPISSEATTAEKEEGGEEDGQNEPSLGQLSVSEANSNSVRLSWSVPTGNFDSFLVRYEGEEDELQSMPVDSGSHEVIVPNLSPSQRYRFDLYGISGGKLLGPVSTDTFTAPLTEQEVEEKETGTPPPQPDLGELSASDVTSNSVRLSWDIPTGTFDSFLIQYNDADNKLQALPIDKETNSVLIDYLVPSNRYKFNLYGVSGRRHVGPSSVIVVTDDETESPGAGGEVDQEVPTGTEPRLGELSVPEVTSNTARLSWSVPVGSFDSFSVQYKDAEGRPQALPVGGDSREVIVPNLVPAHKYKFNLYGTSGNQRLGPISANAVTTATGHEKPGAGGEVDQEVPTGTEPRLGELSVPEVTSNTARLSWSVPVGSFDSFSVQYKDAEGRPQALPVGGDSREVIVPNLVPAHKYKFNLYGTSGNQRLGPISANAVTTATDHEKPGAGGEVDQEVPTGTEPRLGELSVPEVTSNTARLSWSVPVGSFDSFSVQYKDAEGRPQALPVGGDSREVIVPNLVPAHKYKFNLYGTSGNQRLGPISANAVTTATDHEKPGAGGEVDQEVPTGTEPRLGELSVPEVTSNTARLSWSVPVGSFDSFSVQYKDAEGRPQALPVGGDSREVIVPNLVPAHKYKFNLYGTSGNQRLGPISANAVTTATDHEKPGAGGEVDQEVPTGTEPRLGELSVPEVTSNTARLSWSVPVGSFDSFSVQYKDAEGRPQALPVGGDSREVIVPNLVPAHKYKFNLYGTSGNQRLGPISANAVTTAATETTQPSVKEAEPSLGDATVSEVTPDSLLLSWTIQEGSFDSFLIQYKDAAGKLQNLPVDGTMRSLHLYNLTPLQRYKFNIFGVSGHKRLGPVSVDAVTASEPAPIKTGVPQHILDDLSVSNTTSNSVSLSWSVPAGNFDSFLIQYKDREGKPQVLPLSGDSRDVTIPNLAPSHRYKFNLFGIYGHKRLGPVSTDAVTGPAPSTEPGKTTAQLKLGELSAHDITSESLLLSWTVETGNFDSFIIQYRDADGKPHALPVDGGLHSLRLHDLVPSHRYRFNLFGVSGSKRLGPISTEAITATPVQPVPPKPTLGELSASDINSTSAHLSWSVASGNFDSFIIQYRDAEGKPQALPVDGSSRDIIVSNLVPSRRYKFNLYGISGRKRLGPISTEAVTARMKEPEIRPKLGDLSISEVTQDSVRLSWTISAGKFDSFLIQYKDAEEKLQTIPVDADSRTVVISDLMTSHRYNFNLYGISGKKQIGPISTDAVTAFSEVPSEQPVLENLVVSEVTPTTLQLTWDAPEGGFDSFQIRYKDSLLGSGRSPPPAKEMNVPGHDRSALLRGLTPNTEYSVAVSGVRNGSEVANINTVARTSGLELESPRDLRFSDIRETSVVANWRPPSSRIDHYKVSFQPSDGGEPRSIIVDGSKLKTTIEDLTPGASYEVTVMSLRGFEESEPLVGYVTTVPDGPADLRAVSVTDSSAVLTWHPAVAEMNNYIVTYGPAGGTRVSESVPGNRNQLPLSGLRLDTEYRASVYGERDGNRSSPISATFTTGADGPRDLQATDISPRSAHLVWSPPRAPPEGYLLSYKTPYGQSKEIPLDASVTSHKLQNLIPSSRYQVQVQALRRGTPTAPTSTSFTTGHLIYPFPRDCAEESLNGPGPSRTTTIYLGGKQDRPLQVYCDMETDGGGWIVFQRRMNGETDFWRDWQDYATGFGNLTREFWLGNDALHQLTSSRDFELRVDLRARNESVYATYQNFRVDPPADYYRLHVGGYSGTAGDALTYHSGSVFSARDRDPNRLIIPCAVSYRGAWWYRNCHYTNLNGLYGNSRDHQGVSWFNWKGFEFSIPFTEMKLRPRGFQLRRA
ncbi:tenascin-X isoform X4 [Rhineura floridana]|uniref:tenascin-X isoform X4 n=1 Tax=Rhineura floridana TaxID=261503 RepID=UPI002AC8680F|nr:tenascin-X isoform X4 [Rhineura floridana]